MGHAAVWGVGVGKKRMALSNISLPYDPIKPLAICHERILEQARPSRQRATVYRVRRTRGNASVVKENGWEKKTMTVEIDALEDPRCRVKVEG